MSCRRLRRFRGVWQGRCVPTGATSAFSTRRVTAFGSMFRFQGAAAAVTRTMYIGGGTARQPDKVADGVEHHKHDHRPMQHVDGVEPSPAGTRHAVTARHLGPASQFITRPAGAGRDLERGGGLGVAAQGRRVPAAGQAADRSSGARDAPEKGARNGLRRSG